MKRCLTCLLLLLIVFSTGVVLMPVRAADAQPTPKITFNVVVSLEWQPGTNDNLHADLRASGCGYSGANPSYLKDLVTALQRTSAYLYSYSQGQMALGKVTIYTGGTGWANANIRVLASNAYRPAALVGGRVRSPMTYTSAVTRRTQTFYPGHIFLGRLWNGQGARCGFWSGASGWRTIGHEWAHYALFLYDEYYNQSTMAVQYCTSSGRSLPTIPGTDPQIPVTDSLMSYHYRADQLWLNDAPVPASCSGTPQMYVHGVSDWKTVDHFHPAVVPPAGLTTPPSFAGSPAEAAFSAVLPVTPAVTTSARLRLAALPNPGLVAESYLIRRGTGGVPTRIVGQGQTVAGWAAPDIFWGVRESLKDRAALIVQDPVSGERWAYPKDYRTVPSLRTNTDNNIAAPASLWKPGMTITPIVAGSSTSSAVTGLRVAVTDCMARAKRIQISYCPAGGACDTPVDVSIGAGGRFEYTFTQVRPDGTARPLATYGYIYARVPTTGEEAAAWYQIAGGVGPAIIDGHAPLVDGLVDASPAPGAVLPANQDTRLLVSSAQQCTLQKRVLPAGVRGIIGSPVLVQPVFTRREGAGWGPNDPPLRVRLSYDQDLVTRLGVKEGSLVLLRLDPGKNTWSEAKIASRSTPLNWIAGAAQAFGGTGETYAIGFR